MSAVSCCDSKTAPKSALFWSPVTAGSSDVKDELAVVMVAGALWGFKTASFGVGGLAWTRAASFMGPEVLGGGDFEMIWLEMGGFSSFSSF